ncbi:hypothetical protein C8F01DRAFT_1346516 [Mycena amicta]|nr:hypothetical protein C8F01DRAFT_1346516 [Mycena amicta]
MHLPPSLLAISTAADNVGATTCNDINHCRKPSHIVWSCLSTIFIYTYVSMHLNVPGPRKGLWKRCKRIVRMMLFALVAPELFVGFAFRQFSSASRFMEGFRVDPGASQPALPTPSESEAEATRTEGFFFAMGGFVGVHGHPIVLLSDFRRHEYPKGEEVHPKQLELSERERMVENINDKSNKNLLAKAFAFLQGAWFILQCAFRLKERLPLTQLEVMTAAYGAVNIFIWSLWWRKPIGVDQPIRLPLRRENPEDGEEDNGEEEESLHDDDNKQSRSKKGPVHFRILSTVLGSYPTYNPNIDHSVPEFWSSNLTSGDVKAGLLVECLVGCLFGWIHVAAWNSDFYTSVELWIWRGSAVAVTGIPLLLAIITLLPGGGRIFQRTLFWTVCAPLFFTYAAARLLLVGVAFAAVRALPEPVLEDVTWSSWFPHIT